MIVELRHDVDEAYGLRCGLPKVISLEEKYGVTCTFFVVSMLYVLKRIVACCMSFYLVLFGYVLAGDAACGLGD